MAVVPVRISGVLYDKTARTQQAVLLIGSLSISGLEVGGGPILPPEEVPPVEPPLTIWPNPPEGIAPMPEHPIVIPDPITPPITPPDVPAAPHEGWNWSAAKAGWYYLYVPGPGQAQPKKK